MTDKVFIALASGMLRYGQQLAFIKSPKFTAKTLTQVRSLKMSYLKIRL